MTDCLDLTMSERRSLRLIAHSPRGSLSRSRKPNNGIVRAEHPIPAWSLEKVAHGFVAACDSLVESHWFLPALMVVFLGMCACGVIR